MKRFLKFTICAIFVANFFNLNLARGARTVPHVINYQGFVLDSKGGPISTPLTFRFSLWKNSNFVTLNSDGSLRDDDPSFAGFVEIQNLTPQNDGAFSAAVGLVSPLPDLNFSAHKFLQVEVKPVGASDSEFELLDVNGVDDETDLQFLAAAPYAISADEVDGHDVGDAPGNLPVLNENAKLPARNIPARIRENNFVINSADSGGDIRLQFGKTLNKAVKWAVDFLRFEIGDSLFVWGDFANSGSVKLGDSPDDAVEISGDLKIDGKINGRDLNADGAKLDEISGNFLSAEKISLAPQMPITNDRKMVAFFNFDNNFLDFSGKENHGVERGDVKFYAKGKFGATINLDGKDDYIYLDDLTTGANASFDDEIEKRSGEFWFYAYDISKPQIIYEEGGAVNGLNIFLADGKIWFGAWSESNNFAGVWLSVATAAHRWHHVAFTFDAKNENRIQIFHDGILAQTASVPAKIAAHSGDDAIGAAINDTKMRGEKITTEKSLFFRGFVDEFKIFDRVLTANEIANSAGRTDFQIAGLAAGNVLDAISELAAKIIPDDFRAKIQKIEDDAAADQRANEVPFTDRDDLVGRWNFDENLSDKSGN